jgi:hypothetical protein
MRTLPQLPQFLQKVRRIEVDHLPLPGWITRRKIDMHGPFFGHDRNHSRGPRWPPGPPALLSSTQLSRRIHVKCPDRIAITAACNLKNSWSTGLRQLQFDCLKDFNCSIHGNFRLEVLLHVRTRSDLRSPQLGKSLNPTFGPRGLNRALEPSRCQRCSLETIGRSTLHL